MATPTARKLDMLCEQRIPVVSMTFGCPSQAEVDRLHDSGTAVWVTVTTVEEAQAAHRVGVDAIVQGVEADHDGRTAAHSNGQP